MIKVYHVECRFCNNFYKTDSKGNLLDVDDKIVKDAKPCIIYKTGDYTYTSICPDCQRGIKLTNKKK